MKKNLTESEIEVVELVLEGLNNNQIGEKLSISHHTVKAHLRSVYSKMGVSNRIQLIIKMLTEQKTKD